jgi:hypothetical protein
MEEREVEHQVCSVKNEQWWKKRDIGKDREKYKYPLSSIDHLSAAVSP